MDDTITTTDYAPSMPRLYWLLIASAATAVFAGFTWAIDRGIRAMNPAF